MVQVKQAIAEADAKHGWQYQLPKVAATGEALREVEEIDLFGVEDLTGSSAMVAARQLTEALEPVALEEAGLLWAQLVPIGASGLDRDLFLMQIVEGVQVPPVVWFSGGEIDRYQTFRDFVLAMIEYNAEDLKELTGS